MKEGEEEGREGRGKERERDEGQKEEENIS